MFAAHSLSSRFLSIFKPRDPLKRETLQSITILDRMLRELESSKKNLETVAEEHKKKLKVTGDDRELIQIIDEEVKNIHGYLSLIVKTIYDLTRVRYRLETLFHVEEPLKMLPEILEELKAVEPVIEKVNPQLLNHIKALEQRVTNIMTISSPYIPGLTPSIVKSSENSSIKTQLTPLQTTPRIKQPQPVQQKSEQTSEKTETIKEISKTAESINLRPQQPIPLEQINTSQVKPTSFDVPIHVVEQWLLNELRITAGVLDLSVFEKKYGVPKNTILEALKSLESKGQVRVKRKQ